MRVRGVVFVVYGWVLICPESDEDLIKYSDPNDVWFHVDNVKFEASE